MPSMNHLRSAPSTKNAKILMDGLILAIMRATIEYGKLTAPDGRAARSARHDRAGVKFVTLVQAVMIYLEEHPELEPKASAKFANIIRPDILDAMELPRMRSRPL